MSCQLETGGKRRGEVALTAPDGVDTTKAPGNVPEAEGVPKGGTNGGKTDGNQWAETYGNRRSMSCKPREPSAMLNRAASGEVHLAGSGISRQEKEG